MWQNASPVIEPGGVAPGEEPKNGGERPLRRLAWVAVLTVVAADSAFALVSGALGPNTGGGKAAALAGTLSALVLVFVFQRALGLPVGEFGLKRPTSWIRAILLGILVAFVSMALAQAVITYLIQPWINAAPPDASRFDSVRGNLGVLLRTVPTVWLTSAFPEEVIWRGFLMTRIAKLAGGSRGAWAMALILSSVHFGLIHFYQGISGVALTGVVGLLYGLAFLMLGRNLWVPIVAHAVTHLVSFTAMYMGAV